jgi:hypothetical protein
VELTSIKKQNPISVASSIKFQSGNQGHMFKNFNSECSKNDTLSTIPLTLTAANSNETVPKNKAHKDGMLKNELILSGMTKAQKKEILLKLTSDNEDLQKQIVSFELLTIS